MSAAAPGETNWSVQEAKARFSELLDTCLAKGPQIVTRHGREMAVLVPAAEWRRLSSVNRRTLKELLLSDEGRGDNHIPPRGNLNLREPPAFS